MLEKEVVGEVCGGGGHGGSGEVAVGEVALGGEGRVKELVEN